RCCSGCACGKTSSYVLVILVVHAGNWRSRFPHAQPKLRGRTNWFSRMHNQSTNRFSAPTTRSTASRASFRLTKCRNITLVTVDHSLGYLKHNDSASLYSRYVNQEIDITSDMFTIR